MSLLPPGQRKLDSVPPWVDPRSTLKRFGLQPRAALSQNFLVNRNAVDRIAQATVERQAQLVVELGPGVGTLTASLLRHGAHVLAVERDRNLLDVLTTEFADFENRLQIVSGDGTQYDFSKCLWRGAAQPSITLCGNLPYAVTGAILRNMLRHRAFVSRAVFMVQKEVQDRIIAAPGSKTYGALSVFVQAAYTPEHLITLKPGSFHPPPKVTSAVVVLAVRERPIEETPTFSAVVRAAFAQRRKTLRNALGAVATPDALAHAFASSGIEPGRRGETLTPEQFQTLASFL